MVGDTRHKLLSSGNIDPFGFGNDGMAFNLSEFNILLSGLWPDFHSFEKKFCQFKSWDAVFHDRRDDQLLCD